MPVLVTRTMAKRAIEGLKSDKPYARGAIDEYLSTFSSQLETFRVTPSETANDDLITKSIEDFLPARNEFLNVLVNLAQYADINSYSSRLHRFYESLIPYLDRPSHISLWNPLDFDNFKFIVHELFLYGIAIFLKGEHFDITDSLLGLPYYVPDKSEHGTNATLTFTAMQEYVKSLENRNKRLGTRRVSLHSDLLQQRCQSSGLAFRHVMQADLVCFLRCEMMRTDSWERWWPESLLYAERHHGPFEIFARASSTSFLPKVLKVVGAPDLLALKTKIESLQNEDRDRLPSWNFHILNPANLTGLTQLGTRP